MDEEKQQESQNPIPFIEFFLMLLLAGSNDLVDPLVTALQVGIFFLAPFFELAGDAWDIGTGFFLCLWLYMKGAKVRWKFTPGVATGVEVIPGGDIVPSFSLAILLVYLLSSPRAQQLLRAAVRVLPAGRLARAAQRVAGALPKAQR